MFIVGELINSTRKSVRQAILDRDEAFIKDLARKQAEAGADVIDINGAAVGDEIDNMRWLVSTVQAAVDLPLGIDSPSPAALEAGLSLCRKKALVNSISGEDERWNAVLPLVQQFKSKVVALCMDDKGIPESVEDRLRVADKLVSGLMSAGIAEDDIYLDPLIKPLGVNHTFGKDILTTTMALKELYPAVHIISGLSNVSFGLPERSLINRTFMVMTIACGMDAFILDPLDNAIMSQLTAAKALYGEDEFCMGYITAVRSGKVKA